MATTLTIGSTINIDAFTALDLSLQKLGDTAIKSGQKINLLSQGLESIKGDKTELFSSMLIFFQSLKSVGKTYKSLGKVAGKSKSSIPRNKSMVLYDPNVAVKNKNLMKGQDGAKQTGSVFKRVGKQIARVFKGVFKVAKLVFSGIVKAAKVMAKILIPVFKRLFKGIWSILSSLFKSARFIFRMLGKVISVVFKVAGPIIKGLFKLVGGSLGFVLRAIKMVAVAFRILTMAFMTNPIGLIIGGIVLLAGYLIANWEKVWSFFENLFPNLADALSKVFAFLKGVGELIWTFFTDIWKAVGNLFSGIGGLFKKIFSGGDDDEKSKKKPKPKKKPADDEESLENAVKPVANGNCCTTTINVNAPITIKGTKEMDEQMVADKVGESIEKRVRDSKKSERNLCGEWNN